MNEDDESDGDVLANMQGEMKTNRKVLIGLVILATITASILVSSSAFLMLRLWNPIEVPRAKFDEDLNQLNNKIAEHLKNQQSQLVAYTTLQTNLEQAKNSYSSKNMAELRLVLAERERDNREFLRLIGAGVSDLSLMVRGPKKSSDAFKKNIAKLIKESEQREKELLKAGKSL